MPHSPWDSDRQRRSRGRSRPASVLLRVRRECSGRAVGVRTAILVASRESADDDASRCFKPEPHMNVKLIEFRRIERLAATSSARRCRAAAMRGCLSKAPWRRWAPPGTGCSGIGSRPAGFNSMACPASSTIPGARNSTREPASSIAKSASPSHRFDSHGHALARDGKSWARAPSVDLKPSRRIGPCRAPAHGRPRLRGRAGWPS